MAPSILCSSSSESSPLWYPLWQLEHNSTHPRSSLSMRFKDHPAMHSALGSFLSGCVWCTSNEEAYFENPHITHSAPKISTILRLFFRLYFRTFSYVQESHHEFHPPLGFPHCVSPVRMWNFKGSEQPHFLHSGVLAGFRTFLGMCNSYFLSAWNTADSLRPIVWPMWASVLLVSTKGNSCSLVITQLTTTYEINA